jgi:hypothetical protein
MSTFPPHQAMLRTGMPPKCDASDFRVRNAPTPGDAVTNHDEA